MNKENYDLTFLGKFIYYMFKTLELPGGFAPPPGPPTRALPWTNWGL